MNSTKIMEKISWKLHRLNFKFILCSFSYDGSNSSFDFTLVGFVKDFTKIYAISKYNSKVSAKQFERFCQVGNAELKKLDHPEIFNHSKIESAYEVREFAFNSTHLKNENY